MKQLLRFVLSEVRLVLRVFGRAWVRAAAAVSLAIFVLLAGTYVSSVLDGGDAASEPFLVHCAVVVLCTGYGVFFGVPLSLVVALPWTTWKLAGPWAVVPVIGVPLCLWSSFWLCSPLTEGAGLGLVGALYGVGVEHHWLVDDIRVGGHNPVGLTIAAVLLLLDLGAVLLAPSVLLFLALFVLAIALAMVLGLVPGTLLSMIALFIGYARRVAARHRATLAAPKAGGALPAHEAGCLDASVASTDDLAAR